MHSVFQTLPKLEAKMKVKTHFLIKENYGLTTGTFT